MSSLSYDTILSALAALSFADKLRLNEELATALRKEGKSGAVGKALKKEKKAKDPDAPKRKTAAGTLAWIAFVKHCKNTLPERFTECAKEPERLQVAKAIRAEDEAAYKEFCEKFKEEYASAAGSDSEGDSESEGESSPAPAPAPKPAAVSPAEKAAKLAALKKGPALAGGAAAAGGGAGAAPKKPAAAAAPKEKKAAAAPKEAKPKKEPKSAKKAAAAAAPEEEVAEMPVKEIDGTLYFFDPETNGLWMREEDGGHGAWVGRYQPGDEEEPIRFTDSPADE